MAEQMQPMPDVPERCPFCNSGDRREETWQDKPAYSFSCGTVCYANGEVAWRYFACYTREKEQEERAIREQLAAALAEAERWRKKYEALMAAVIKADELIVDAINHATEMYNYTQEDYYESYSDGLDEALMFLRQLLDEDGGGDT